MIWSFKTQNRTKYCIILFFIWIFFINWMCGHCLRKRIKEIWPFGFAAKIFNFKHHLNKELLRFYYFWVVPYISWHCTLQDAHYHCLFTANFYTWCIKFHKISNRAMNLWHDIKCFFINYINSNVMSNQLKSLFKNNTKYILAGIIC